MDRSDLLPGRLAALAGLGFALILFFSLASVDAPRGASDQEVLDWWSDSGYQTDLVLTTFGFALAGVCFLVFLTHLRARLHAAEGGSGSLSTLVFASGVLFVAMLFVAGMARGVVAMSVRFGDEPLPGVDMLRYMNEFGATAFGVFGMFAVALMFAATSVTILRTGAFGRWLAWLGFLLALATLAAIAFFAGPFAAPALQLWVLATSIAMWRGRGPATSRIGPMVPTS